MAETMSEHDSPQSEPLEELVGRARGGDADAFASLCRSIEGRLEGHVQARMGSRARARVSIEDVVQETLVNAHRHLDRLTWRGEAAFYGWLRSIAEHLISRAVRGTACLRMASDLEPAATAPSASRSLIREERARRLKRAIGDLSADHRQVILLTRVEGLRIAEAAARMGRSPNAVRKLLGRALEELRQRFGETTGSLRLAGDGDALEGESG